jgi:hypothetical protein
MVGTVANSLDSMILSLPGVVRKGSRWKHNTAYIVAGREFAHFHSPREIDVRVTKTVLKASREELREDSRVKFRPRPSDWVTITLAGKEDVAFVFTVVERAWRANGGRKGMSRI